MRHRVVLFVAHHAERSALVSILTEKGAESVPTTGPLVSFNLPVGDTGMTSFEFTICLTGQGNVNAADETSRTLSALEGVALAIFVGTSAGLKSDLPIGQVFVPSEVAWIQATKEAPGGTLIRSDKRLKVDAHLLDLARANSEVLTGQLITADTLLETTGGLFGAITSHYNSAQVYDMESGGFLEAAQTQRVPCIVVRSVMDHVVDRQAEPQKTLNQELAARQASLVALQIAEEWRLRNAFDSSYAVRAHRLRNDNFPEANAESLVQQLLEHVTGAATQQHHFSDGSRVDVIFTGGLVEVETDLRRAHKRTEGENQIERYLNEAGQELRGVGVLTGYVTDGVDWTQYELTSTSLVEVGSFAVANSEADTARLIEWLVGGLTPRTVKEPPTPSRIDARLGADSPARRSDRAVLEAMWSDLVASSEAHLKRSLWATSLRTALGTQFVDDDELFIDHTYLVLLAELIANRLLGVDITAGDVEPVALVTGTILAKSKKIGGVVEADFFDWVLEHPQGEAFVRRLCSRVDQFNWGDVEHDVLKHLYESVIGAETRKALGEYYTPDWLARLVVDEVVRNPLEESVLDPACGSGTFLFHAIRNYMEAAENAGVAVRDAVSGVTAKVLGFDLHPVAVSLARVTYLLAIGTERLQSPGRPPLQVPVYLADSLRWTVPDEDVLQGTNLHIRAGDAVAERGQTALFDEDFVLPVSVVRDAARFDRLISELDRLANLTRRAQDREIAAVLDAVGVRDDEERTLVHTTYVRLREMVEQGRDGIWSYYIRNQARPAWLAAAGNGVDCLVGNPPWLRYSLMPGDMQDRFKTMSKARDLWSGGKVAHSQDLAGLFVARTAELYLRDGGAFGFVLPEAVLRANQYEGLRSGNWSVAASATGNPGYQLTVELDTPWNVGNLAESFPFPSSVLLGRRSPGQALPMPEREMQLVNTDGEWIERERADAASAALMSEYGPRFRQGASLVPRFLAFVTVGEPEVGAPSDYLPVRSQRTSLEKMPWKDVEGAEGTVDEGFLFDVHLGSTIVPYRALQPLRAVLPVKNDAVLDPAPEGMRDWWDQVSGIWESRKSDKIKSSLSQYFDYHNKLSVQFPLGGYRVVYTKSGSTIAATVLTGEVVIDHKLYWLKVESLQEAQFLAAVLNSETVRAKTERFQSRGLFGARDFDKYVFVNPIPTFDPAIEKHTDLALMAARAGEIAAAVELPEGVDFKKARRLVRRALVEDGVSSRIDDLVAAILDD